MVLDEKNKEIGRYGPDSEDRKTTLRKLWEEAGRSARNADQKIDFILEEVGSKVKSR